MRPHLDSMARAALATLVGLTALAGCSTQQLYLTAQQWQKQECDRIQDREARTRCEKEASLSYERYKAEADKARR